MTTKAKFVLLAAGSIAMFATPALAASDMTERFVANVQPNIEFLDSSSRLASTASASPKLRAFAHAESREQADTGDALTGWAQTSAGTAQVAVLGTDAVMTGRSVAIDGAAPTASHTPAPGTLLPSGEGVMGRLAKLGGHRFDALYRSSQRDVLTRLAALYADYMARGDDPALRALAARELPKMDQHLAQLRAL